MKYIFIAMILAGITIFTVSCSINSSKLDTNYVQSFAEDVRCAKGYAGKCWCFVASRQTGVASTTGIGMTLAPKELCE